ncbi:MAG: ABC transporter substrate-binding protein [Acetobacteraceae bacterium]
MTGRFRNVQLRPCVTGHCGERAAPHAGEMGYSEGRNLTIEYRWAAGDYERLPVLAAELVARKVDVIVTAGANGAAAAAAATSTIPIVCFGALDMRAVGLISNLARPGGNLTGIGNFASELNPKRLQLLAELVPASTLIGVLANRNHYIAQESVRIIQDTAQQSGHQITIATAATEQEIGRAFETLSRTGARALLVLADPFFNSRRQQIVGLAAQHAMPAIYEWREFVDIGGLISYGPNLVAGYRQLGQYAGRVLAGANPGDLPIARATHLELVVNLKTAHALGLTIPPAVLARADDVLD